MAQNQIDVFQAELKFRGYKYTKQQVADIIRAFGDTIHDFVRNGDSFRIPYVGTFTVKSYEQRKYRCPKTQDVRDIPQRKRVRFMPSESLKRTANQKSATEE